MSWSYLTYCVLNFKDISSTFLVFLLNGHIFVVSPSIRRRSSTWKVRGNYIDFERRIHVEIMTSSRRGNFDVDSTFKVGEILMTFPRGFFDVVSKLNRDVTSLLAVSIALFHNFFCSGNLF